VINLITFLSIHPFISTDIILSAAHCAGYASSIELGRFDRTTGIPLTTDASLNQTIDYSSPNYGFDTEYYESIEVAYEIKHPSYNPDTVNNDFLLVKLIHPTTIQNHPLATLNSDPNIPTSSGEELHTMGWGDTDVDPDVFTPSATLLTVLLNYVPNYECVVKEGYVSEGDFVSYRPMSE